jgi:hypothetical protein
MWLNIVAINGPLSTQGRRKFWEISVLVHEQLASQDGFRSIDLFG